MAAAWLAQRDDGLTAVEQADFDRWQQADPRHAAATARLEKTWTTLQHLREFRPASRIHPDRDLLAGARPPAQIISFRSIVTVAGLAAAVALGAFLWRAAPPATPAPGQPVYATSVYATTADGYQRVTLEDGSVLELNANSQARVDFTPAERHVRLEHGEAHFTVARNKHRPFIVHAGSVAVQAVGTAFNVRMDEGEVEVLVTEGRVKVANQAAEANAPVPELGAGQRLVVTTGDAGEASLAQAEAVAPEAMAESLAWQGPRLRFDDTPLSSVVAQFNRHNQIQIEVGDASLMSVPVDGSFRPDNVEAFIRLLESDRSIRAERIGKDRIILRRVP